jgi:DNA polymerase elongation subunit (family B)
MRKTLTLDIETSPHLCYSFQTWNTNIMPIQILDPTRVVSVSAKWEHERKVMFFSEYEGFAPVEGMTREECHLDMVQQIFDLMDEADVVVTYNGDKFDLPHLKREFHLAFGPHKTPSPFVSVDLYKVIKAEEIWVSHKLAYITDRLGLSGKLDNSGWRLWLGILSEDPDVRHKAWLEMRRYNKRDTKTTEELKVECHPFIKNLPNPALFEDGEIPTLPVCQSCESTNVSRRGWAYTKTRKYPRFHCQDCGKWSKGTRSEGSVSTT